MHELSLALSILDGVEQESAAHGGLCVRAVRLRVGTLAAVSMDALTFAYQLASQDTVLAGTRLVIECVEGRELLITALEVDP
ncbi:MAG: hydrogenase maturation nickel metallochaperone HypA [Terriglobales bacterium]